MTQTDIKRVLAYSTLSQLGYMFAALGVGAFTAAIFHLMTHGFFKGLLFLGSGSVIHAVHEEQDMRRMGGLAKKIPITYATMLVGSIAIAGIPPLAGFFSKDEILGEAFKFGFYWVWGIGLFVALLTAFYMFRLMGLTFWGTFRGPKEIWDQIHESPRVMTVPLILLAIPSVLLGMAVGLPLGDSTLHHWLAPVFHEAEELLLHHDPRPVRAVRHRRRPDPGQRGRGGHRRGPRLALLRRGDRAHPAARPAGGRARDGRPRARSCTAPRSTSGGSTNSTTCCSSRSAGAWPMPCGGSIARSSTARSTPSAGARSPPAAGSGGSRPAGSRTTPWASRSGSS